MKFNIGDKVISKDEIRFGKEVGIVVGIDIREDIKDKHPYVVSFCDEYTYTDNNDETYWKYCKTN